MDISQFVAPTRLAVLESVYPVLVKVELALLALAALAAALKCANSLRRLSLHEIRPAAGRLLFFFAVSITALTTLASAGRPILSPGFADPGTILTRMLVISVSPWQRRLVEPMLILLLASAHVVSAQKGRGAAALFFWVLFGAILLESTAGSVAVQDIAYGALSAGPFLVLHAFLMQCLFGLAAVLCRKEFGSPAAPDKTLLPPSSAAIRRLTAVALIGAVFVGAVTLGESASANRRPALAGAHYYSWFPENWVGGYAGRLFDPPVVPLLDEYSSADPSVFEQHVEWAKQANLRYFIFDWWPRRKEIRRRIKDNVQALAREPEFKFAIQYETLDLKEPKDTVPAQEDGNVVIMTPLRAERLKKHWELIARSYMAEPGYLRIDRRPVLFVYATRHLVGPVREAVEEARRHVYRQTGLRLFLVADEAFYNVLDFDPASGVHLMPETAPNWERLSAFDAVTCYNPYDPQRPCR